MINNNEMRDLPLESTQNVRKQRVFAAYLCRRGAAGGQYPRPEHACGRGSRRLGRGDHRAADA